MTANRNFNVKIIERDEDFASLHQEWNQLLERSEANTIFLTWEWLYTWWQHFNSDRQLAIILIEHNNQLVGIAPFFREHFRVGRFISLQSLQWLGIGEVGSDYLNLISEPGYEKDVCRKVCEEISHNAKNWDLLKLTDLPSGGHAYTNFFTFFAEDKAFEYQLGREYICPYIQLKGYSWGSFLKDLSANMRYNLRRRNRQVFELLGAKVTQCEEKSDIAPFLDSIFDMHLKRWNLRGGSDGFSTPQVHAFHQAVAIELFNKGWLRLYLLEIEHKPVAGIYGMEYKDTFYFYQSGMLPEWERYSVGMVLLGQTIKDSISRQLTTYDFLHGTENYKFNWTQTLRHTSSLIVCPSSKIVPKAYFLMQTVKKKISSLITLTANKYADS